MCQTYGTEFGFSIIRKTFLKKFRVMKTLKASLIFIWILAAAAAGTAAPEKQEPEWPKKLDNEGTQIAIYQPQINSMEGDILDARAAISVKQKGEKLVFGAMWFTSRLVTDFDTRLVTLTDFNIESVKFPNSGEEEESAMISLLEAEFAKSELTYSLDRLLTSLKTTEQSNQFSEQLDHTPPKILIENEPAVLVLIDGEPILQDIEDTRIQYVVNTPYFILYNKADGYFYLKGGDWWYRSGRVENTWRYISNPPNSVLEIKPTDEGYVTDVDSMARLLDFPPKVILSKVPAEIIVTDGEPDFAALEGTDLLYVRNTESEILMDINSQQYFVLIAGRWYRSGSLDSEDWEFVRPDDLPEYFAGIGTDSEMGSVRSSIPDTREAREAILENEIPQTAEVDRKKASMEVAYDGNPQFEKIQGTDMAYAINTDKSVLFVDNRYYAVDNAVWFVSDHATGPWEVCVSVPDDVQSIPPEYPVYNVKYVYVYDYTPDIVYVGYTPGYVYSYPYRGTIVYGTGYHYHPWYRTYYYPRPVTYGYGVHYNPYTGWGFSVGISYGWIGYSYYRMPYYYTSWWGPAGYCYGYRHGYYQGYSRAYYGGYYYGYNYGVYASSRSGYRAGYYDGQHHHAYSQNIYKSRPNGVVNTGTRPTAYGSRTGASSSRSSYSNPALTDRKNNVYTDRNGNVYRKKGDSWETREEGSWKKSELPDRSRTTGSSGSANRTAEPRTGGAGTGTVTRTRTETTGSTQRSSSTGSTGTRQSSQSSVTGTQGSYGSRQGTGSPARTGQELQKESQARSQGSQRTYDYRQSQQQRQPQRQSSASPSRSSSSTTKSSSTTRTSRTTQSTGTGQRKK
jgi:hypothetical protein